MEQVIRALRQVMAIDMISKEGTERCFEGRNKSAKKDRRVKDNSQISGIKN